MARQKIDDQQRRERMEQWVRAHSGQVYRTALYYMKDHAAAEDVTQDAFLLAYRHMDSFRGQGSPAAWLMRIAANRAKEELRSRWHRSVTTREDWQAQADRIASTPSPAVALEDRQDLLRALGTLDDKLRRTLLLYYYYDFRDREIAWLENVSPAAVRKRLERGRRRLASILSTEGTDGDGHR